jgi:hypothetical protein
MCVKCQYAVTSELDNGCMTDCGDESVSAYGVARTGWYGMC